MRRSHVQKQLFLRGSGLPNRLHLWRCLRSWSLGVQSDFPAFFHSLCKYPCCTLVSFFYSRYHHGVVTNSRSPKMCMHVCMCVYVCVCVHPHACFARARARVCLYSYAFVRVRAYICVCARTRAHVCACMDIEHTPSRWRQYRRRCEKE